MTMLMLDCAGVMTVGFLDRLGEGHLSVLLRKFVNTWAGSSVPVSSSCGQHTETDQWRACSTSHVRRRTQMTHTSLKSNSSRIIKMMLLLPMQEEDLPIWKEGEEVRVKSTAQTRPLQRWQRSDRPVWPVFSAESSSFVRLWWYALVR